MFIQDEILEFITKIINQSDESKIDEIEENIKIFRDYLKLTKMCEESVLEQIDKIIKCVPELINLKIKLGSIDITTIFESSKNYKSDQKQKRSLAKTRQPQYEEKHYSHYSPSVSSSCGSSSHSYSSSCGGGSISYTSRC